jgi:fumarate reductase flavoprotein subunit
MGVEVTRRNFLTGAGVLGAGGLLALSGCSPAQSSSSSADSTSSSEDSNDWLGSAPDITPDDCASTEEADVIVVGSGVSGSTAAYSALKQGATVKVLEKHSTFHYGGNGFGFLNSNYQKENGVPVYDEQEVLYRMVNESQMEADIALCRLWAYHSGEILDEIIENITTPYNVPVMVKAESGDPETELNGIYHTGIVFGDPTVDNAQQYIAGIHSCVEDMGGEFVNNMRGEKLVLDDDGAVQGIIASDKDGAYTYYKANKGVIMCTGSFGADEKMCKEFFPEKIAELWKTNDIYPSYYGSDDAPTEALDTGDGHKMMCWAGAVMQQKTHPYLGWPLGGAIGSPYLQVNQAGNRFMNETTYMINELQIIMEQPTTKGFYTWQIISDEGVEMPNTAGVPTAILQGFIENGESYTADTIADLASQIDVDADALQETVDRYNELCDEGVDEDYSKDPTYMIPVRTPPFTAVRVNYGLAVTMGGVLTNSNLQVLNEEGKVIPGLYAVGHTVGRRFGWAYQNRHAGMTNSFATVHGYVAGAHCANL